MTMRHLLLSLCLALMPLTPSLALAEQLPSPKKIELDLKEQLNSLIQLSLPHQAEGLLGIFSVKVLSRERITEDRFSARVRIVKGRTNYVLPNNPNLDRTVVRTLADIPPGTSMTEEDKVYFRLKQGEWRMERIEMLSSDSKAFKDATDKAELEQYLPKNR